MANTFSKATILFLSIYIFISTFIIGFIGFPLFKLLNIGFFGISLIMFLITRNYSLTELWGAACLIILISIYLLVWKFDTTNLNLFVVIFYGFILSSNQDFFKKILVIIFFLQLTLVFYETITGTYLFEKVSSGLINSVEFDSSERLDEADETGFRPKGLFPGTLVATSFIIYFTLIFRNNLRLLSFNLLLSFMVNGRLALLVTFVTFLLKMLKLLDLKIKGRRLPKSFVATTFLPIIIIIGTILGLLFLSSAAFNNLLEVFNFNSMSNLGRILRMFDAYNTYFFDYSTIGKLFGTTDYVLVDVYNRPVPPEAELAGMLLEVGFIGVLLYSVFLFKTYKSGGKTPVFSLNIKEIGVNYVIIINVICMLVYRHFFGNERGSLLWFIIFSELINSKKNRKV